MTEQEAKTKWCPFSRAANKENGSGDVSIGGMNRWRGDELLPKGTRCLGPACMAWRWSLVPRDFKVAPFTGAVVEPERPADVPASYKWTPADRDEGEPAGWAAPSQGFCGLAGKA